MRALALYRGLPLAVRLHVRVRAATAPLATVVDRLPARGRVLEVGCGHGLLSNEAALRHPGLGVLGVDPAPEKVRWASATQAGRPNVAFRCAPVEDVAERGFDAVVVCDVLYLVPAEGWAAFLGACRERLRPGGALLLKEVDRAPRWKFYRCYWQELLAVRLLGITRGRAFAFAGRAEMTAALQAAGYRDVRATGLGAGYWTPHVLYEARA